MALLMHTPDGDIELVRKRGSHRVQFIWNGVEYMTDSVLPTGVIAGLLVQCYIDGEQAQAVEADSSWGTAATLPDLARDFVAGSKIVKGLMPSQSDTETGTAAESTSLN